MRVCVFMNRHVCASLHVNIWWYRPYGCVNATSRIISVFQDVRVHVFVECACNAHIHNKYILLYTFRYYIRHRTCPTHNVADIQKSIHIGNSWSGSHPTHKWFTPKLVGLPPTTIQPWECLRDYLNCERAHALNCMYWVHIFWHENHSVCMPLAYWFLLTISNTWELLSNGWKWYWLTTYIMPNHGPP